MPKIAKKSKLEVLKIRPLRKCNCGWIEVTNITLIVL